MQGFNFMDKFLNFVKKHKNHIALFCLSALLVFLFCNTSPLYKFNDMPDIATWSAQAEMILDGKIMYKDIYEHKGPLQLIPYVIAGIFPHSYDAMFVIEIVLFFVYAYFLYKIAELYDKKNALPIACLSTVITAANMCFANTGTTEELFLWVFPCTIYLFLRRIRAGEFLTKKDSFIIGVLQALLLWSKYTLCTLTIGICLFMIYWHVKEKEDIKNQILYFFLGVLAVSAVVCIYFAVNGALYDLFKVYFYNTIFVYDGGDDKIVILRHKIIAFVWYFFPVITAFIIGKISGKAKIDITRIDNMFLFITASTMFLFLFTINRIWAYYFLPSFTFSIFPVILIFKAKNKLLQVACTICVCMSILISQNWNLEKLKVNQEEYLQFKIYDYINQSGKHKILCLAGNSGFYYYTNSTPFNKYFTYFNITFDELEKEVKDIEENQIADFIIHYKEEDIPGYKLVINGASPTFDVIVDKLKYGEAVQFYLYEKIED